MSESGQTRPSNHHRRMTALARLSRHGRGTMFVAEVPEPVVSGCSK